MLRLIAVFLALAGSASADPRPILVMGDSILDWNRGTGRSVADALGADLGRSVENASMSGARLMPRGFLGRVRSIPAQYARGDWSWVVLDGGANDLLRDCGCARCDAVLDRLITPDGQRGAIPTLIREVRAKGPRVLWMGYYGPNGRGGAFDACEDELRELDARVAMLAARTEGVAFADAGDVMGPGNAGDYHRDNVHPGPRGSARIGRHLAAAIREAETGP